MKALAIRRYKATMELMELPRPDPGPGDLLVRVRVATPHPSLLVASVSSSIQRAYAARNSASSVVSCCCTCAISLPAVA